ncbi:hypothetical protein BDZ89DRAFT_1069486 [Hymenopellis radicata]|nr:hypothetical protein BDZ89DRAFT_1069486 [Hymenopellis radicata]
MTTPQTSAPIRQNPANDNRSCEIGTFVAWCVIGGILSFYTTHYAMMTADEGGFETLAAFCEWRVASTAILLCFEIVLLCMAAGYGMKWSHKITAFCGVNLVLVILSGLIHVIMTRHQKAAILTSCAEFNATDTNSLYYLYYPYAFIFYYSDVVETKAEAAQWCRSAWNSSIFWDIVLYVLAIVFTFIKVVMSGVLHFSAGEVGREPATHPQGYHQLPQNVEAQAAPSTGGSGLETELPPYKSTQESR